MLRYMLSGFSASQEPFLGPVPSRGPELPMALGALKAMDKDVDLAFFGVWRTVPFSIGLLDFGTAGLAFCYWQFLTSSYASLRAPMLLA